ncbi:MAG: DUF4328 domain-containing protein [Saprospiraceae bacterium]|nr:DUF4328 domain-containing protein [Saprospiraceae bacterium]
MQINYNGDRAKRVIIAFYFLLAVTALSFVSNFLEFNFLSADEIDYTRVNANDARQMIMGIIQVISHITVVVLFIMWFRRAYNNLHLLGRHMAYSEGWAAGAWFIPFLNLVRPYEIMREIWIDTQEYAKIEPRQSIEPIGWWWAMFLINNIVSNIASRLYMGAESIDALRIASGLYLFSDVLEVLAILLTIPVIKKVSEFEELAYRSEYEVPIEDHLI